MANHLDLEEQEQLDQIKHFWTQYGGWITTVLIVVSGAVASWIGYQYWQRSQATQATALFDEVERVINLGDVDKAQTAFNDMRARYAQAVVTQDAALRLAALAYGAGKLDTAKAALTWAAQAPAGLGYTHVAKLRLASIQIEEKDYDSALKTLDGVDSPAFSPLAQDKRGDLFALQGKPDAAKAAYLKSYQAMNIQSEYRRIIKIKLNALGVEVPETAGDK